jgi:hypothetical protein
MVMDALGTTSPVLSVTTPVISPRVWLLAGKTRTAASKTVQTNLRMESPPRKLGGTGEKKKTQAGFPAHTFRVACRNHRFRDPFSIFP